MSKFAAVTPPATPTPTSTVSLSKSLLTEVAKDSNTYVSKTDVTASQLQLRPRAVYASNKPGISLLPFNVPPQSRTVTSLVQSPNIIIRASVPPRQIQIVDRSPNTAVKLVPTAQVVAPVLLVQPSCHTSQGTSFKPIKRSASALALSTEPSTKVTSTSSSLLQSVLLEKSACIIPKRGSAIKTKLRVETGKTVSSSLNKEVPTNVSAFSLPLKVTEKTPLAAISCKLVSSGLSQSLPSSPTSFKTASCSFKEADHDYCSNKTQLVDQFGHSQTTCVHLGPTTDSKGNSVNEEENKKTSFSDEEARTVSSLDAELLQDIEYLDEHCGPSSPLVNEIADDNVLEDGEVLVDEDGNDSFPQLVPSASNQFQDKRDSDIQTLSSKENMPYQNKSGSTVAFNLAGEDSCRRRGRRYRRRTELNTSPIREDKTEFFDKIPAFYTALSIPTKPTKMSVFASATKSLGSTDHLEPDNKITEHVDTGLYDKVPAHRRCFTNTTKELELNTIDPPEEQSQQPIASSSLYPMSSSLLSSSSTELNPESSTSPRHTRSKSRRKTRSRHLSSCSGSSTQQSWSVSQTGSMSQSAFIRSKEHLKSRSRSRSGSVSSRSCSTCSSYSSGDSCGSSCSGCSRSRSRSCSTCSSSDSSQSR